MRPVQVRRVVSRHVRELIRERRTIMFLLLLPLVTVFIFSIARDELVEDLGARGDDHPIPLAVAGREEAPRLIAFLERAGFEVVDADPEDVVRDGAFDVGLRIPARFDDAVQAGQRPRLRIVTTRTTFGSRLGESLLSSAIDRYAQRILRARLEDTGLPPSLATPVRIEPVDVSTPQERSGSFLGEVLPFIIMAQVVGMMSGVATDVTVGEKERRTVEALLATPLTRREVVTGKLIVVTLMGLVAGSLTLAAGILSFRRVTAAAAIGGSSLLPAGAYARAFVAVVAFALFIGGVQLLIGFFARSTQQAGIMLSPVFFLSIFPVFFFEGQSGMTISEGMYAVPGLGAVLLARNGLAGTAAASAPALVLATHVVYAALAVVWADRVFHSERALLRGAT